MILLFAVTFCTVDQHRVLLKAHVAALFVSQIIYSTKRQGDEMAQEHVQRSMVTTFCNIVLSLVGIL